MQSATTVTEESKVTAHRSQVAIAAWLGMLLMSRLPQIIAQIVLGVEPGDAYLWYWLATGLVLIGLSYIWSTIRPLRGYFGVLTTIYALTIALDWLVGSAVWRSGFGAEGIPWVWIFFGERLAAVLLALGVIAVLLLAGRKRRDLYLAHGNWRAPTRLRLPGREQPITWLTLGPAFALILMLLTAGAIVAMMSPDSLNWQQLINLSPLILLFALMNGFAEEAAFRAAPLSQLVTAVSERQAIWLTAVWFALGHYYGGIPSGPVGAIFLTFIALVFGRAMLATKGITLPVFMHLLGDIVVYSVLVMSM